MKPTGPFDDQDRIELGELLAYADEVVAMREIAAGEHDPLIVGLRHDVDNTLEAVQEFAEWEYVHGWRATYFILHDSPYWNDPLLRPVLEKLADLQHEIGLHCNGIAEELRQQRPAAEIVHEALERLRGWGHNVVGTVAHGDDLCYNHAHEVRFVNDEMFAECARPGLGHPARDVAGIQIDPKPLAEYGLLYDANHLSRAIYLSDSGNRWNDWSMTKEFPTISGQLHMLIHPCWWTQAFDRWGATKETV
jgi:hypothetical protein